MTPNLARYYRHAMQRIYDVTPAVPAMYDDKMLAVELELMEHHISPKHYAEAQAVIWKDWVTKMGLTHLPLNLFLSITAKARYNKLLAMPTVEPVLDRELDMSAIAMTFERDYAKWYIGQLLYKVGIKDAHQALDVYLEDCTNETTLYGWLDYCEIYGREKLVRAIIIEFCSYWDIRQHCLDYFQVACRYVDNLKSARRELAYKLKFMDARNKAYSPLSKQLDRLDDEYTQLKYGSLL